MSTYPPRRPVSGRLTAAARNPFVAALLGGLVVLLFGVIAVAAGWLGDDKTTVVQSSVPARQDAPRDLPTRVDTERGTRR